MIYLGSRTGGGGKGEVWESGKRVLAGTLVGGLGVGVGREWWRAEMEGEGQEVEEEEWEKVD